MCAYGRVAGCIPPLPRRRFDPWRRLAENRQRAVDGVGLGCDRAGYGGSGDREAATKRLFISPFRDGEEFLS